MSVTGFNRKRREAEKKAELQEKEDFSEQNLCQKTKDELFSFARSHGISLRGKFKLTKGALIREILSLRG